MGCLLPAGLGVAVAFATGSTPLGWVAGLTCLAIYVIVK